MNDKDSPPSGSSTINEDEGGVEPSAINETDTDGITTTAEELEGFYIIKSILREEVNTARIQYKDTKSYFGVNLDGKVTKTVCRLRFYEKTGKKSISIPDNIEPSKEATTNISTLDEIYGVAEFLKARIRFLTQESYTSKPEKSEMVQGNMNSTQTDGFGYRGE